MAGDKSVRFNIVARDQGASQALERVRVAVIDARGEEREVVGRVMELDLPEGVEWPPLPLIPDDGRAHYMEITGPGEAHCLPDCWCQGGQAPSAERHV